MEKCNASSFTYSDAAAIENIKHAICAKNLNFSL
jgi:hypothetical protein